MINYAHRGASEYFPENTLSSFYAGLAMGANGIETDVHMTRDGVLILFHDDTVDRVTDGTGDVTSFTYREILDLRVTNSRTGRTDIIVSLEDFLRFFAFRDLTFAVELKQPGIERETVDMLNRFGVREKTVLTSFDFGSIAAARAYDPRFRVGYLHGPWETEAAARLRAIGGEEICPRSDMVDAAYVAAHRAMGFSVRAWGVKDADTMRRLVACGVDGMTVNFPDLLTACLAEG